MTRADIAMHGLNHVAGGSDPIPGLGAAVAEPRNILAVWHGTVPQQTGADTVWAVPTVDGAAMTFNLNRAFVRVEDVVGDDLVVVFERSPGGGGFTATTLATVTVLTGDYEAEETSGVGTCQSGQLLRISWSDLGDTSGLVFLAQLEGVEA